MGKRLLLVYSLLNAFLYFGITVAAAPIEASRLTELLTQSFDCLKGQEQTVRAILLESQREKLIDKPFLWPSRGSSWQELP